MVHETVQQRRVRRYLWRVAEVVALLVFLVAVVALFVWALPYLLPFVIGGIVAVLAFPLVRAIERTGIRRAAAATMVLAAVVVIVVMASVYAIIAVARETALLSQNMSLYFSTAQDWLTGQIELAQLYFGQLPPKVAAGLENAAMQSLSTVEGSFRGFLHFLLSSVTHLPETIFVMVIAFIAAFFMLVNRERMYRKFLSLLPPGWGVKIQGPIQDMSKALAGTIRVQIVLMLMSAVLGIIGMWVLRIPYAIILGLVFGLSGIIPIFGSAVLTVPWAIGALVMGDISLALKLLLLQVTISLIRHIIEPKILAENVGLDMLSTLFALYVGMKVMGVLGLFLGPIILIGIKSMLRARMFVDFMPAVEGPDAPVLRTEAAKDSPKTEDSESSTERGL